jgi:hypothetical protein
MAYHFAFKFEIVTLRWYYYYYCNVRYSIYALMSFALALSGDFLYVTIPWSSPPVGRTSFNPDFH